MQGLFTKSRLPGCGARSPAKKGVGRVAPRRGWGSHIKICLSVGINGVSVAKAKRNKCLKGGEGLDILSLVTFAGGLAFFLYGMSVLSSGLERLAGGKLELILKKLTEKKLAGVFAGAGITVAVQSSSAVTVMLVGLVSSGMIEASKTIGIIMGSNVGTTLTPWLLAFVGVETGSTVTALFKPENFSLIMALFGAGMLTFSRNTKRKNLGTILVGFGVLMTGMKFMSTGAAPFAASDTTAKLMLAFENPFLAVFAGAFFTGIIQSSAASVGILQAVALTGKLSFASALPVIVGQNIGTCVTASISCIGVGRNAKKVTLIHVLFNVIGAVIFLSAYYILNALFSFPFAAKPINSFGIALVHTVFNLSVTLVLLPASGLIIKLSDIILPDKGSDTVSILLPDERLLATPFAASAECFRAVSDMGRRASGAVRLALELLFEYDAEKSSKVLSEEKQLDKLEDELGSYLLKLSKEPLSGSESIRVSGMLHVLADFERLGDHGAYLCLSSKNMVERKITFSEKTLSELLSVANALCEAVSIAETAYRTGNLSLAKRVEPLRQVIDALVSEIRGRHIGRLRSGTTTLEKGFILSDLLICFERISDHCSNVALCVISLSRGTFDSHTYLRKIRTGDPEFIKLYDMYSRKYIKAALARFL